VTVKSSVLRAVALASSVSIGVFLVARANSGCSSETQSVAQPEAPAPSVSGAEAPSGQPAAVTAEEQFFQGSKAPGGTGLRPPAPAASSVQIDNEEFIGGSKSGRMIRPEPSTQQNANPPVQQK
jgi:hypothetical protein